MPPYISVALAVALLLKAQFIAGQLLGDPSELPACWQRCFKAANELSCENWDLKCICRASNGSFLPDAITCGRMDCQSDYFDASSLLVSLQLACSNDGGPIAPAALTNAENAATTELASAAASATGLQTFGPIYMTPPSVFLPPYTYTTRTVTTTDDCGAAVVAIEPLTIMPSTVVAGHIISIATTLETAGSVRILITDGTTVNHITPTRTTTHDSPASCSRMTSETGRSTSSAAVGSVSTITSVPSSSTSASTTPPSSAATPNAQNTNGSPFSEQSAANAQQRPLLLAGFVFIMEWMIN